MLLQKTVTPLISLKVVYIFPSYLTILPDHDVVTVAVSNSQNISSYTVACTRQCELFDGLIQFIPVGKKGTISLCLLLHSWHFAHAFILSNVQYNAGWPKSKDINKLRHCQEQGVSADT